MISTPKAPAAVGPYSQGVKVGDTVYVSGCIGLVPGARPSLPHFMGGGGVGVQLHQARTVVPAHLCNTHTIGKDTRECTF